LLSVVGIDGSRSAVVDNPGEFSDFHFVYTQRPEDAPELEQNAVYCEVDEQSLLSCSVMDQNIIQLFSGFLSISAGEEDGAVQSDFTIVLVT